MSWVLKSSYKSWTFFWTRRSPLTFSYLFSADRTWLITWSWPGSSFISSNNFCGTSPSTFGVWLFCWSSYVTLPFYCWVISDYYTSTFALYKSFRFIPSKPPKTKSQESLSMTLWWKVREVGWKSKETRLVQVWVSKQYSCTSLNRFCARFIPPNIYIARCVLQAVCR